MSECVIFYEWSNEDSSRFSCIFCKTEFSTAEERDKHHQKAHLIPRPQCEICNKEFSSEKALEKHLDVKHLDKASKYTTECPTCHIRVQQLRAHIRIKHENKLKLNVYGGVCPHCKKTFLDDYKVKRHIQQVHNNVRPYTCVECQKSFLDKKDLKRHIRGVHFGERVNRWGKYANSGPESTQIVKKQFQPIDKQEKDDKALKEEKVRSSTFGTSGTYFSADSLGSTVIQTKPPELLVAEEEPDNPAPIGDHPAVIESDSLVTNEPGDDQELSNIEIVITPHESSEEYIETSQVSESPESIAGHNAMVVTVLPEEMQAKSNMTMSKVNLEAMPMLDSSMDLVNLKSKEIVQEDESVVPVEVSAIEVSPVEVSAMEVTPVEVSALEVTPSQSKGDSSTILIYGKYGEVVQLNDSSHSAMDNSVYYINSEPSELVLEEPSDGTIVSFHAGNQTLVLSEPNSILPERNQMQTYVNAQEQDSIQVPEEDQPRDEEDKHDQEEEAEEECIVIRMDENGQIDTAEHNDDGGEKDSRDNDVSQVADDDPLCLVYKEVESDSRSVTSLAESRYQVSRSRRDSTGDLVLELVEKEQPEPNTESETKYVTVRWGEEVMPRSKAASFPFPTVDRRLPEMLFSETTEKICEDPSAEKIQDQIAEAKPSPEKPKDNEPTEPSSVPNKKKIRRKLPKPVAVDENVMKCPVETCEQRFKGKATMSHYQKHYERIHLQLRNYPCEHCDFKFFSRHDLGRHNESVHSKIKTVCPIVGCKRLVVRLDLHIKNVHNQSKPKEANKEITKCGDCGQTFNRAYDLKRHNDTVHLGRKKFKCSVCERGFTDKRDLVRHHAAVHLKIKQKKVYTCTNCEQKYKRKKDLVEHLASLECRNLS